MDLYIFCLLSVVLCLFQVDCEMGTHEEQRTNIRFLTQAGQTPIQICWSLQEVYGDDTLSYPQVRLWHHRFQEGHVSAKDNPRTGCPASRLRSVQAIRDSVQADRHKTLQEISAKVGRPTSTVFKVIKKDLNMHKLCPKFVPHFLTDANKAMCKELSTQNLKNARSIPHYLDRIVSGNETWVSLYNQETKFESCQWTECSVPCPTKIVKSNSIRKTMLILFYNAYGVLLVEFVPRGETVDTEYYCNVLTRLKEWIRRKHPGLWLRDEHGDRNFWLHQDNATPHTSTITLTFFGESGINLVPHPPFRPDLAPCDFTIFPHLKKELRGTKFANIEEVQNRVCLVLIKTEPEVFYNAIQSMAFQWKKCMVVQGDYFEGQNLPISDISEAEVSSDEDEQDEAQDN